MNSLTDQQLLRAYAEYHSEEAFAELVQRYVDFVYSAALRMVRDTHLAEDVSQRTFAALADNAEPLSKRPVLSGWLHRTAQNIAAQTVRTDIRRRIREKEAATMNELLGDEPDAGWEQITPHLDAALGELSEPDRDALLLRYFERKSARAMAEVLGVSDEAAQKRVNRAVDRLRESLAKRGVAVGASGLAAVIAGNAIQAAPAGLAAAISTTVVQTSLLTLTTKAVVMTSLQKTLVGATLAAAIGLGIHQAYRASTLGAQIQSLQDQLASDARSLATLRRERDDATASRASLQQENERLRQAAAEVPKLRGDVAQLRTTQQQSAAAQEALAKINDPEVKRMMDLKAQAMDIAMRLEQMPEKKIPELKLLQEEDWLAIVKGAKLDTAEDIRKTFDKMRSLAKNRLPMANALSKFVQENNGQLPTDMAQLKPYLKTDFLGRMIDDITVDSILNRYQIVRTGNANDLPKLAWVIAEKAPVDKDYDSRAKFGLGITTVISTGLGEAGDPEDKNY